MQIKCEQAFLPPTSYLTGLIVLIIRIPKMNKSVRVRFLLMFNMCANPVPCCARAQTFLSQARGTCQVLQLLAPGMNVYVPASPFILQGLAQGTMCTLWGKCVRHSVM